MIDLLKSNATMDDLENQIKAIIYNDMIAALSKFTAEDNARLNAEINPKIIDLKIILENGVKKTIVSFNSDELECLYKCFTNGRYCISAFCDCFIKNWNNKVIFLKNDYYFLESNKVSESSNYIELLELISYSLQKYLSNVLRVPNPTLISILSGQSYERNELRESIAFGNTIDGIEFDFKYDKPILFSFDKLRQCRKALEVAYIKDRKKDENKKFVFLCHQKSEWYIYGLVSEKKVEQYPKITFKGKSSWILTYPVFDENHKYSQEYKAVQYKNDLLGFPSEQNLKDSHRKIFENFFSENSQKLWKIAKAAEKVGKGTTLIFTNDSEEIKRIKSKNLGTNIKKINLYTMLDSKNNIIKNLCSVDGAVIVNEKAECECFAVILDGEALLNGDPSTGSRHNSAKNYIAIKKKKRSEFRYIAVVVSDDSYTEVYY